MTTYGTLPTSSSPGPTNLEYLSRANEQIKNGIGTRRPWSEMLNISSLSFPHSLTEAYPRVKRNIAYFRMNYVIIILLLLFLSLLWHPVSLIVFVAVMGVWLFCYFLRDEPLVIVNRVIDDRVVLVVLLFVTVVVLLFTGVTVNVVVTVLVSLVVVVVHGVVRKTNDLFLDEDDVEAGGYLAASSS